MRPLVPSAVAHAMRPPEWLGELRALRVLAKHWKQARREKAVRAGGSAARRLTAKDREHAKLSLALAALKAKLASEKGAIK